MILLKLNRPEYFNDICDEIRLFYPADKVRCETDVSADETDRILTVEITTLPEESITRAKAVMDGLKTEQCSALLEKDHLYVKRIEKRNAKICVFRLLSRFTGIRIPWGSLTGIRPTKLFRTIQDEYGKEEAESVFREQFSVSEPKIRVAETIVRNQQPYISDTDMRYTDIYIHIPFCNSKCLYCSFPSEVIRSSEDERLTEYLEYLEKDILMGYETVKDGGYSVRNIYIGGGTPSVLSARQTESVLNLLNRLYYRKGMEFTVEAGRPDSLDREKLSVMKQYNVNRISINPQTMQDETLVRLGRHHTSNDILNAFEMAKNTGFDTINMDLIAGLPGETAEDFSDTIEKVDKLDPENLTIHTLAIKRSSKLHQFLGDYPLPDEDTVARMVDMGYTYALSKNYLPYYMYRQKYMTGNLENIGYSKENHICVYNIDMMEETTNILAHGANAMSKRVFSAESRVERIPNPKDLKTYMEKLNATDALKRKLFVDSLKG